MKKQPINIHIVIPGQPVVKKNTHRISVFIKDKKTGRKKVRPYPLYYYTERWKEWAGRAIIACYNFKEKHPEYIYPITDRINLKVLFYLNNLRTVDLSALYEGIQDVLAGNAGIQSKLAPESYQILFDDSFKYIGSHDGSRIFWDKQNPRTEVFITEFIL